MFIELWLVYSKYNHPSCCSTTTHLDRDQNQSDGRGVDLDSYHAIGAFHYRTECRAGCTHSTWFAQRDGGGTAEVHCAFRGGAVEEAERLRAGAEDPAHRHQLKGGQ